MADGSGESAEEWGEGGVEAWVREELVRVVGFWLQHSPDEEYGGFFDCLDRDGSVYDETKHVWLQGREVWMLARVASELSDADMEFGASVAKRYGWKRACGYFEDRKALVELARKGVDFLRRFAVDGDTGHVYFALRRDGAPAEAQRKPFSGAFLVMALCEVAGVLGSEEYLGEAEELFDRVKAWAKDPSLLGRPTLPGAPSLSPLNVPMILLNVSEEVERGIRRVRGEEAGKRYGATSQGEREEWVKDIVRHFVPTSSIPDCPFSSPSSSSSSSPSPENLMLENIDSSLQSPSLSTPSGRLSNPGHAIEAGWFVYSHATHTHTPHLIPIAIQIIQESFQVGWDEGKGGGGILYFLDACGKPPVQLESNMKLWWPICEAMIAFAMIHDTEKLEKVASYAKHHFSDPEFGEWFGYLDQHSHPTHSLKGGPYKGCFHVPRALLFTYQALSSARAEKE